MLAVSAGGGHDDGVQQSHFDLVEESPACDRCDAIRSAKAQPYRGVCAPATFSGG